MNAEFLHVPSFNLGTFLFVEPGTMLQIAGVVVLAALAMGYYLYTESKRESKH